jgi:hypothetical protein
VSGQHGGVADVLGDHGLAQTVCADQDQIAGLGEEVQCERPLDDIAFDALGPGPFEVGHGLEPLDLGGAQAAFKTAVCALGSLDARHLSAWRLHSSSVVNVRAAQDESRTKRIALSTRPF